MQISKRDRLAQACAASSIALIAWTLILSTGYYTQPFLARMTSPGGEGTAELERLACIERTVETQTEPGERIRLEVVDGDEYLRQRVSELVYPRVDLVEGGRSTVVVVGWAASAEALGVSCGDVIVSFPSED
jgi:hypothetical protein